MTSATNEKQIAKRLDQAKQDGLTEQNVIESLMSLPRGRRWVFLQLEFAQIWTGNEVLDPQYMAFEKGRRNTGLKLLAAVIKFAPSQFVKMQEENSNTKLTEEQDDARSDSDSE